MPTIVDFPEVVKKGVKAFESLFENEPERRHLAEYLTGLIIAEHKNVVGINRELVQTTDQSCLNRWITEVDWDPRKLNDRRLLELQKDSRTRYSPRGVIAMDNTLVDHEGKMIEDVGYFWDHADKRHVIAHDYIISNYVASSGYHYPIEFRRFRKKDTVEKEKEEDPESTAVFKNHTELAIELIDDVMKRQIPGDFTFDSYFTNAEVQNHIQDKGRNYVGDFKQNRWVIFQGREIKFQDMAVSITAESRKSFQRGDQTQWYFTVTIRVPEVNHKVRILIIWDRKNGSEPVKVLITNRTNWEATRMLLVYRSRWTGTETFHRDAKQQLGMGDCQLMSGQGHDRHMYLVFTAYSLLVRTLGSTHPSEWARRKLKTIGEACQAVRGQTLEALVDWVVDKFSVDHWSPARIKLSIAH